MRYLTKEWYETMQKTSFHLGLRADKRAESFNEELYRRIYQRKLDEQIKFEKECSSSLVDTEEYNSMRESFDEDEIRQSFKKAHKKNISFLKSVLPREILENVADIRLLALDVCTAEVKKLITDFCKSNEREYKRILREANNEMKKSLKGGAPGLTKESFHDCEIISCRKKGNDIVIRFDNSYGFTDHSGIIFRNAQVIEKECRLNGMTWLYNEVYKTDGGYEIHTLLWRYGELKYFTVKCSGAELLYDI